MVLWPLCGMEYDGDRPILSEDHQRIFEVAYWGTIWGWLPVRYDNRYGELFDALFEAREVFTAIGGAWLETDLLRFAFERTKLMPQWARNIPVPIVKAVMDYLEAARRRFILITHLVLWTDCFGDGVQSLRAIDRYIGKTPSRIPDCLGWTPREGHWSKDRMCKRRGIRDELGVLKKPTTPQLNPLAHGGFEVPSYGPDCECELLSLPFRLARQGQPGYIPPPREDITLHRTDRGPVDVLARSDGSRRYHVYNHAFQTAGRPHQDLRRGGRKSRESTWAVASIHNTRSRRYRRSSEVTACKMEVRGAWRLVRGCEME